MILYNCKKLINTLNIYNTKIKKDFLNSEKWNISQGSHMNVRFGRAYYAICFLSLVWIYYNMYWLHVPVDCNAQSGCRIFTDINIKVLSLSVHYLSCRVPRRHLGYIGVHGLCVCWWHDLIWRSTFQDEITISITWSCTPIFMIADGVCPSPN